MEPVVGTTYELRIGAGLLGKRPTPEPCNVDLCTLRYDFKPASVGKAVEGQLELCDASQKVRSRRRCHRRCRHCCHLPSALAHHCTAAAIHSISSLTSFPCSIFCSCLNAFA